jgi:hypothetical protein
MERFRIVGSDDQGEYESELAEVWAVLKIACLSDRDAGNRLGFLIGAIRWFRDHTDLKDVVEDRAESDSDAIVRKFACDVLASWTPAGPAL